MGDLRNERVLQFLLFKMWKSTGATTAGFFDRDIDINVIVGTVHSAAASISPVMFFIENKGPIQAENDEEEKGK